MSTEEEKAKARERARASYYANKERYLERGRAWRAANKDKVKAYNAAYHAENRERENGRSRAWKEENRESMNARRRAGYVANIEQARAYARSRKGANYALHPQKYRNLARLDRAKPGAKARQAALSKVWAERNPGRTKAAARRCYQRNLDHARLKLAISQASRRLRNVSWANQEAIAAFYAEAALLTRTTGRKHVVDHIIPLRGRTCQVFLSRLTCALLSDSRTHASPTSGNHRDGSAPAPRRAMCRSRREMRRSWRVGA